LEKLGLNLGYLIVQILNFAVVFLTLKAWVYDPLTKMLAERREKIAQGLEDARIAAEARANAEKEADRIITEAQGQAAGIVRDATQRAESVEKDRLAGLDAQLAERRQNLEADLEQQKNVMLANLRGQVVNLAIAGARQLIQESLSGDESRQRSLLDEFFTGIRKGQVTELQGQNLSGEVVEVISAIPLNAQEQETVRNSIGSGAKEVRFRTDPALLGGIVVRAGDRVIDASVRTRLQEMRQSLQ